MSDDVVDRFTKEAVLELPFYAAKGIERWRAYCDSPIETLLLASVTLIWKLDQWGMGFERRPGEGVECAELVVVTSSDEKGLALDINVGFIVIAPQFRWNSYRIDFAFLCRSAQPLLFVECDGHDFHNRTPEQAEWDRRRDREVQLAGIPVIRFTGREIYRDPFKCASDVLDHVVRRIPQKTP